MSKTGLRRRGNELRDLLAWAKGLGFDCVRTNGGHIKFIRPNTNSVYTSLTPSCYHAYDNARAEIKRAVKAADRLKGAEQ